MNRSTRALTILFAFLATSVAACDAHGQTQPLPVPINLDLEQGTHGAMPTGWIMGNALFPVQLDTTKAHTGRSSLWIRSEPNARSFGNGSQLISAVPYRGQRIRYTGWVLLAPGTPAPKAQMWLRVDKANNQTAYLDNMGSRPIRWASDWRQYTIVGDVPQDAERIYFGLILPQVGAAWLDDAQIEVLGPTPPAVVEAPRALTDRGLENLAALTRLVGYVRYFHPSDGAAATDWDAFTIAAARRVESAANANALRSVLDSLFGDVAPGVAIVTRGNAPVAATMPAGAERIQYWMHRGIGIQTPSVYWSRRVPMMLSAAIPDSIPNPLQPVTYDLGGGVSVALPLAVYSDATGTLPRSTAWQPANDGLPEPTASSTSASDRATRLVAVMLTWNVFQHFYPYFDVVQTDWPTELKGALASAATDTNTMTFAVTLRRMVAALQDGHGGVYHSDMQRMNGAIPPIRWDWIENNLVITAEADSVSGVAAGDVVLSIDGEATADVVVRETALASGATPEFRRYSALSRMLPGPPAETLALTVRKPNGDTARVSIARNARMMVQENRPAAIAEVSPGIMYVDLDRATTAEFRAAVPQLAAARGLIFDMRGYPRQVDATEVLRHLIKEPSSSAQWHIPAVTRPDQDGLTFARSPSWNLQPMQPHFDAPRVFLTGPGAISYAESVMGIVEAYKLAEIVGGTTAGTNGNVNPFTVPGGFQIAWTGMKVLKHDGSTHHGVGIAPTVPVARTIAGVVRGEDEVLAAAVKLLRGRQVN